MVVTPPARYLKDDAAIIVVSRAADYTPEKRSDNRREKLDNC